MLKCLKLQVVAVVCRMEICNAFHTTTHSIFSAAAAAVASPALLLLLFGLIFQAFVPALSCLCPSLCFVQRTHSSDGNWPNEQFSKLFNSKLCNVFLRVSLALSLYVPAQHRTVGMCFISKFGNHRYKFNFTKRVFLLLRAILIIKLQSNSDFAYITKFGGVKNVCIQWMARCSHICHREIGG